VKCATEDARSRVENQNIWPGRAVCGFSGYSSGGVEGRPGARKLTGNFAGRRCPGERVPPLAKPFGVGLDRPLEVAGRGRDGEGARDLRYFFVPISQSTKKGPKMVEEGLGSSQRGRWPPGEREDWA
jgi:hypothetical protein